MRCEGTCGRSFRNGDTAYAQPTRILIVRGARVTFEVVDKLLCEACNRDAGHASLNDRRENASS